jgi:hypothetical protein
MELTVWGYVVKLADLSVYQGMHMQTTAGPGPALTRVGMVSLS